MDENLDFQIKATLRRTVGRLEHNGFNAVVAASVKAAQNAVLALIKKGDSVGFGGSMTLKQLNLLELIDKKGSKIFAGKQGQKPEETLAIRRQALHADVFIASPNAVTLDGKLMFWDGIGNRVAGMIFGPGKVIAVAGFNKLAEDEAAGWRRMKTLACPANCKRLKLQTPCVVDGLCRDCSHAQRICNIRVVLDKKPKYTEYYVILVPEQLGY